MRRFLRVLAATLVGLAIASATAELAVLLLLGPQVRFPRRVVGAPWGLRMNEPGAVYRHESPDVDVEFRINAEGMRADRDQPREKPAGVQRIVSLGDSFTLGYEVRVEDTFSSVLERELRKAGRPVEVLNAGVPGFGTAEECLYLERELFEYQPDLVLLSFYPNDLVENERCNLFRLEKRDLVAVQSSYVPGGKLGDLLRGNALVRFLSGHSNAFALLAERTGGDAAPPSAEVAPGDESERVRERRLAAAILERVYRDCRGRRIPLVIQSLPTPNANEHPTDLYELFPDEFDVRRDGIVFVPAKAALEPYVGKELLYNVHSHQHWTPLAHRLAGEALARAILARNLLGPAPSPPAPSR